MSQRSKIHWTQHFEYLGIHRHVLGTTCRVTYMINATCITRYNHQANYAEERPVSLWLTGQFFIEITLHPLAYILLYINLVFVHFLCSLAFIQGVKTENNIGCVRLTTNEHSNFDLFRNATTVQVLELFTKIEARHNAIFAVTGGTGDCHRYNFKSQLWRQSLHHDNSWFSVLHTRQHM